MIDLICDGQDERLMDELKSAFADGFWFSIVQFPSNGAGSCRGALHS